MILLQLCQRDWYCQNIVCGSFMLDYFHGCSCSSLYLPPAHLWVFVWYSFYIWVISPEEMMGYNIGNSKQSKTICQPLCEFVCCCLPLFVQDMSGEFLQWQWCHCLWWPREETQSHRRRSEANTNREGPGSTSEEPLELMKTWREKEETGYVYIAWLLLFCYKSTVQGVMFSQHRF